MQSRAKAIHPVLTTGVDDGAHVDAPSSLSGRGLRPEASRHRLA
jgi:hypothetical protein